MMRKLLSFAAERDAHSTLPLECAGRSKGTMRFGSLRSAGFKDRVRMQRRAAFQPPQRGCRAGDSGLATARQITILPKMTSEAINSKTIIDTNNLRELLEQRVSIAPDKTFLLSEVDGRRLTYAEFDEAVNRSARMLAAYGVTKGDAVSL